MTPPRTSPRLSATFLSPKPRSYVAVREYPACLISPHHSSRTGARGSPLSTVHARVRNPHRGASVRPRSGCIGRLQTHTGRRAAPLGWMLHSRWKSLPLSWSSVWCWNQQERNAGGKQGEPLPGHETHPALCFSLDHSVKRLSPCGDGTSVCYQSEFHARDEVNGGGVDGSGFNIGP